MSEQIYNREVSKPSLQASMSLQTYEYFRINDSDGEAKESFVSGDTPYLVLSNEGLWRKTKETPAIEEHVLNLDNIHAVEEGSHSADYRLAEAYFLLAAREINSHSPTQVQIDQFALMNRELYGEVDPAIFSKALSTIWRKITAALTPHTEGLYRDVKNGFKVNINGEVYDIPPFPTPEDIGGGDEELPKLDQAVAEKIKQLIEMDISPVRPLVEQYVERFGDKLSPIQLAELYKDMIRALNLDIAVLEDEDASVASWSSAHKAVVIGLRRKPIEGVENILGLFVHEVLVHGRRFFNGSQYSISLGSGLFTDFDTERNEEASYLTFEEGLATTLQKVLINKAENWDIASLGNYVNIGLATHGYTPLQIQETMSRVRTILSEKKSTIDVLSPTNKSRENTATQVVRVFRGTPAHREYRTSEGSVIHYGKDKAYLAGRVKVIEYLNNLGADRIEEVWASLFNGKYDPTNSHQQAFVEKVVETV